MKKLLLLILSAISIQASGQNMEKHNVDGFIWYEIGNGYSKVEIKDASGNIIIPLNRGYGTAHYRKINGEVFFIVSKIVANKSAQGICDKYGKEIISPDRGYWSITPHNDGDFDYFSVYKYNGKIRYEGICDKNGREIISPNKYCTIYGHNTDGYKYFEVFKNKNRQAGICDVNGNEIISPDRGYKSVFVNGDNNFRYIQVKKKGFGICDIEGNEIISPTENFYYIALRDWEGVRYFHAEKSKSVGVYDTYGNVIAAPNKYSDVEYREDGFYYKDKKGQWVSLNLTIGQQGVQSLTATTSGTKRIYQNSTFEWYKIIKQGTTGDVYGAEDMNGNIIIPLDRGYEALTSESAEGSYNHFIIKKNGYKGICDINGNEIISPSLGYKSVFVSNITVPLIYVSNGRFDGLYDLTGKEIISVNRGYNNIVRHDDYISVKKNGYEGACDLSGKEIISPNRGYSSIYYMSEDSDFKYYVVKKNGVESFCDVLGVEIVNSNFKKQIIRNSNVSNSNDVLKYHKAAEQGDAYAQANLGVCYSNGHGVAQNYAEALKWYRKAAEQGHAGAQKNIGYQYEYGQGVAQSYTEAVKWYQLAANQGDSDAQKKLSNLQQKMAQNNKPKQNTNKSTSNKSSSKTNSSRKKNVSYGPPQEHQMYISDNKIITHISFVYSFNKHRANIFFYDDHSIHTHYEYDYDDSDYWYYKWAQIPFHSVTPTDEALKIAKDGSYVKWSRGNEIRIFNIKKTKQDFQEFQDEWEFSHRTDAIYLNNRGVEFMNKKEYSKAFKWFKKAATKASPVAECNLGICYLYGYGVEKNYSEAVRLFKSAVICRYANAQYMLGECYMHGYGVDQNYSEAVKWYRVAAGQGFAKAIETLESLGEM